MNQTRLLIGILLLLGAVFGYTQWSHRQDLRQQRDDTAKLIEVLTGKTTSPAATATTSASKGSAVPGTAQTEPETADVEESEVEKRFSMMSEELEKLRAEKENLRLLSEAAGEERDRMASENEALKYQIDQRIAQIRAAPMLAKISYVNAQHGVAVMSAGRQAGVEPRDEFRIRRGDKIICRAIVGDSVEDTEAALSAIPGSMAPKEAIMEGDEVVSLD